jgi:2'-5' RNA ligase
MRGLFTVSFPQVPESHRRFMHDFQQSHQKVVRGFIEPHFTLVFGTDQIAEHVYTEHVAAIAASSTTIPFTCQYAMLGADEEDDTAYVFLVPDDGYAAISVLHDQLYSGVLESHLRLDLPFVPHVTVGSTKDRKHAKSLCDALNRAGVRVEGVLDALTVGTLEEGRFVTLTSHAMCHRAASHAAP